MDLRSLKHRASVPQSTHHLRFLAPKTISLMDFGSSHSSYLDPWGITIIPLVEISLVQERARQQNAVGAWRFTNTMVPYSEYSDSITYLK